MAAASTLISVSEYLASSYRPDRDYLEGELEERNVGEQPHARIQGYIGFLFRMNQAKWGVRILPEQRVQVRAERFRVPDLCVVRLNSSPDAIITVPPLLCIEVLSSGDTLTSIQTRASDYSSMGVENIWVIDPWNRLGYYASPRGFQQPGDGVLRVEGTPMEIILADVFAELDEA